jgi:hypothetical protein
VAVLLNALGRPEPSPETVKRLMAIDPALFLRYIDAAPSHWAVCWAWPRNDRRWAHVQDGSLDPQSAYDIIGYLPMDCSASEAPAYLERMMRTYPKEEISRMADAVVNFNATDPIREQVNAAIAEVLDSPDPTGLTKTRRGKKVQITPA